MKKLILCLITIIVQNLTINAQQEIVRMYPEGWPCENVGRIIGSKIYDGSNSETVMIPPYYYAHYKNAADNVWGTQVVTSIEGYANYGGGWMVKGSRVAPSEIVIPNIYGENFSAFYGCDKIRTLVLPPTMKYIGTYAFQGCSLNVLVCMAVTPPTLADGALDKAEIKRIQVPKGTLAAYKAAEGWKEFPLGEGAETYSDLQMVEVNGAWYEVEGSKASLVLSGEDPMIPKYIDCLTSGMWKNVPVTAINPWSVNHDIVLNANIKKLPVDWKDGYASSKISVSIGDDVTEIPERMFENCPGIRSITIPKSVTRIDSRAFAGCPDLASIIVAEENPVYDSRNNCNAIISKLRNSLIVGCKNTIIPNGVEIIDNYAFYHCSGLKSIDIPEGVKGIYQAAFMGCTDLKTVKLPQSLTSIGMAAFFNCISLVSVTALAKIPSAIKYNSFDSGSLTLYVPKSALGAYSEERFWKNFSPIVGIDVFDPLTYYDLNGSQRTLDDKDSWINIQKSTPNALAVVESAQAEWASQHQNVLTTNADGSYSCADFLLTDLSQGFGSNTSEAAKTGFFTPVSFKVTTGDYKRQAYAGYNTLCLPFSFKASDLSSSARVFIFDTYDAEGSKVIFKAVSGPIAAGTPCIVKENADIVWTVSLAGKTIEAAQPSEDSHMRGTYVTTDAWQGKGYSPRSSDGKFAPLTQYLHPFRACFSLEELDAAARGSLSAVFMDEDGVTAIDTLSAADNAADAPKSIYTLSGQRVKEVKRSGLYIVNGKKQYIEVK